MWAHIEQVMAREQLRLTNPKSGTEDEAQNLVMDVNFGLNDYGRMQYMMKMAKLLSEKKKYEALIKSDPSKRD